LHPRARESLISRGFILAKFIVNDGLDDPSERSEAMNHPIKRVELVRKYRDGGFAKMFTPSA